MAVITIPSTATEQQNQQQNLSETGDVTSSRSFKDTYSNGQTWINALSTGDTLGGWVLKSASLSRMPGDMGILTLNLSPSDIVTEAQTSSQIALDETWSLKAVRNDKSLLAYCGISPGGNPNRVHIEAWLKEPDGTLAAEYKYSKTDGTIYEIGSSEAPTRDLIDKFRAGFDSVMRFYPMLTKKRTYSTPPASVYEKLAYIDTPSVGTSATSRSIKQPGNLSTIISGHQWLKCQDDVEQTADGKFVRVESWIGAKTGESSWDENFYGTTNRWSMPYLV